MATQQLSCLEDGMNVYAQGILWATIIETADNRGARYQIKRADGKPWRGSQAKAEIWKCEHRIPIERRLLNAVAMVYEWEEGRPFAQANAKIAMGV